MRPKHRNLLVPPKPMSNRRPQKPHIFLSFFCNISLPGRSNNVVMAESVDYELLVRQFNRGDESAFETIVEQYSAEIALLANRLLGWPGDVEDVTQDTFLAAFLGLKKFRCQCSLKTWLFTITINKCRTYRHKRMLRLHRFSQAAQKVPRPHTAPPTAHQWTTRPSSRSAER